MLAARPAVLALAVVLGVARAAAADVGSARVDRSQDEIRELVEPARGPLVANGMVVAGAGGDLAAGKVIASMYRLWRPGRAGDVPGERRLPDDFRLVLADLPGFAEREIVRQRVERTGDPEADFRHAIAAKVVALNPWIDPGSKDWQAFAARIHLFEGNIARRSGAGALAGRLAELDRGRARRGWLVDLATPPSVFRPAIHALSRAGVVGPGSGNLLAIEKPFGTDARRARNLETLVEQKVGLANLRLIDHYVGKLPQLAAFRFLDGPFEGMFDGAHVSSVTVSLREDIGIKQRGRFYDRVGAARDVVQNHGMRVLAMALMDRPAAGPDGMRVATEAFFDGLRVMRRSQVRERTVRGQYVGDPVKGILGYREEADVSPRSGTETYAALLVDVDETKNARWRGTSILLEGGKRLAGPKKSEVKVTFRKGAFQAYDAARGTALAPKLGVRPDDEPQLRVNLDESTITFEPRVGVQIPIDDLIPEARRVVDEDPFGKDAYARLFDSFLHGDDAAAVTPRAAVKAWDIFTPILAEWYRSKQGLVFYKANHAKRPPSAERLLRSKIPRRAAPPGRQGTEGAGAAPRGAPVLRVFHGTGTPRPAAPRRQVRPRPPSTRTAAAARAAR